MSVSGQLVMAVHVCYESQEPRARHHRTRGIFAQPTKRHLQLLVWWRVCYEGAVAKWRGGISDLCVMGAEGSGVVTHLAVECDVKIARCRPADETGNARAPPPTTGRVRRAPCTSSPSSLLANAPVVGALDTLGIQNELPIIKGSGYALGMADTRVARQAMHERHK